MLIDAMHKSNLMNHLLHYMLEHPKALSTILNIYIAFATSKDEASRQDSENLKDVTMDNQQETKVLYFSAIIFDLSIFLYNIE